MLAKGSPLNDGSFFLWDNNRRILGVAPFGPALVVVLHIFDAHQFQRERQDGSATPGLAIRDRWPGRVNLVLLEEFDQSICRFEALRFLVNGIGPFLMQSSGNCSVSPSRFLLTAELFAGASIDNLQCLALDCCK